MNLIKKPNVDEKSDRMPKPARFIKAKGSRHDLLRGKICVREMNDRKFFLRSVKGGDRQDYLSPSDGFQPGMVYDNVILCKKKDIKDSRNHPSAICCDLQSLPELFL